MKCKENINYNYNDMYKWNLQSTFQHRPVQILFQRLFEARYVILEEIR